MRAVHVVELALVALLAYAAPAFAQTQPRTTAPDLVAVLDLESINATAPQVAVSSERLRQELLNTRRFRIVDRGQMAKILDEQSLQQTGCTSQECAVQVGKVLGVRKLIVGKLTKVEDTFWVVSASMIDVESGETTRVASADVDGTFRKVLDGGIGELAAKLTGNSQAPATAAIAKPPGVAANSVALRSQLRVATLGPTTLNAAGATTGTAGTVDLVGAWKASLTDIQSIDIIHTFEDLTEEEAELIKKPRFRPGLREADGTPNPELLSALAAPYGTDYVITAALTLSPFDLTVFFFAVDTRKATVITDKFYIPVRSAKVEMATLKTRLTRVIADLPKPPK